MATIKMESLHAAVQPAVAVDAATVAAATPLLEHLPFPALWIDADYSVCWANPAAASRFRRPQGKCYECMHGYDSPCDTEGKAPCRSLTAARLGQPCSALHVHSEDTTVELYKVISMPLGRGVLEFHVPMDEAYSRDGLTGLLSRPVIEQIVRQNINLLRRLKQPCAVALIDIDHFKQVNDRYGHAAGDNYLKAVGEALKRTVRNTDVVGRWGGEEFMVFMPGTDRRGASATVTKLLQALRQLQVEHQGSRIRATASAGIWVGHPRMPFEKVYESADAALYRAKEQGRDRFSFAMELVSSERSGPVPDAPVEQQGGSPS